VALAQGKLAEALAVKDHLRDALIENVVGLFINLTDPPGLILGFGICKLTIRCKAAPVVPLL
jgi:hypothetical protein